MLILYRLDKSLIGKDFLIMNELGECVARYAEDEQLIAQEVLDMLNQEIPRIVARIEEDKRMMVQNIQDAIWGSGFSAILESYEADDYPDISTVYQDEKLVLFKLNEKGLTVSADEFDYIVKKLAYDEAAGNPQMSRGTVKDYAEAYNRVSQDRISTLDEFVHWFLYGDKCELCKGNAFIFNGKGEEVMCPQCEGAGYQFNTNSDYPNEV